MDDSPVVVVTGASSGIGAATARLFGQRGWRVVLAARRQERLEALARDIEGQGGQALVVPTDVTQWPQVRHLAQTTWSTWGRVAATGHRPPNPGQRFGHIINVASVASFAALPTYSVYAATKFGLRGFTDALRREVEPLGLRVSAIYPGPVATEFGHHAGGPLQRHGHTTPARLVLRAEDVARAIWQLAQRPRRGKIVPWWFTPLLGLQALVPKLLDVLMVRTVRALRAKAPTTSQGTS